MEEQGLWGAALYVGTRDPVLARRNRGREKSRLKPPFTPETCALKILHSFALTLAICVCDNLEEDVSGGVCAACSLPITRRLTSIVDRKQFPDSAYTQVVYSGLGYR